MKLHISRKIALVGGAIVLGVIGGTSAEMANKPKVGADTSPIVTQVDHQNDRLNNHEARITNLEGATKDLQDKTSTSSTNTIDVPDVRPINDPTPVTTTSSSVPLASINTQPTSITVVSYKEIVIDPDTSDCEYTYSDDSTYTFHWKISNLQGSWVQPGGMGEGHWEKTTNYYGYCDNTAIGRDKSMH